MKVCAKETVAFIEQQINKFQTKLKVFTGRKSKETSPQNEPNFDIPSNQIL